jgi:hypothetical protein
MKILYISMAIAIFSGLVFLSTQKPYLQQHDRNTINVTNNQHSLVTLSQMFVNEKYHYSIPYDQTMEIYSKRDLNTDLSHEKEVEFAIPGDSVLLGISVLAIDNDESEAFKRDGMERLLGSLQALAELDLEAYARTVRDMQVPTIGGPDGGSSLLAFHGGVEANRNRGGTITVAKEVRGSASGSEWD